MDLVQNNKYLILKYWNSWQKPDWEEMKSCLAEHINFGDRTMKRDQFVQICQQGNPWENVSMIQSVYTRHGGAILYEGTDSHTKKRIRVGEFIQISNDKIISTDSAFGSSIPPVE